MGYRISTSIRRRSRSHWSAVRASRTLVVSTSEAVRWISRSRPGNLLAAPSRREVASNGAARQGQAIRVPASPRSPARRSGSLRLHWTDSDEPAARISSGSRSMPSARQSARSRRSDRDGIRSAFLSFYATLHHRERRSNGFCRSRRRAVLSQSALPIAGTSVPETSWPAVGRSRLLGRRGQAFAWSDGNRFIVEYRTFPLSRSRDLDFEVVLDASGEIASSTCTSGLPRTVRHRHSGLDPHVGLQVSFILVPARGLACGSSRSRSGSRPRRGSPSRGCWHCRRHRLHLDAAGLSTGTYAANLQVSSNDPDEPVVVVPWSSG